ncbi:hypothetical protein [uncultured Gimesia sp.]|uniref:hypothetical protein n=1 Tax=uncultured Gimesia sp. TaxID=1678688 RepID=UPI0030D83D0D|tara:strand:+ start:38877 stop:39218 length:342 start_codon:yes stop_codon:yes gene_type:complete
MSNTGYLIALTVTCIIVAFFHYFGFRSNRKSIRICLGSVISPQKAYELHAWCSNSDARKFIPSRFSKYGFEVFVISPSHTKPGDYTFGVRGRRIENLLAQLEQDSNFQVVEKE